MRTYLALAALTAGAIAMPSPAQYDRSSGIPMSTAMTTQCELGTTALTKGSTPTAIDGVTVVSPVQAKCLIDRFGKQLLVIAAMDDQTQLPDAYPLPILASTTDDAAFRTRFDKEVTPLTGGNLSRPILIYCHHASCQYSANGAEHLARIGYKKVFWLRDGTKGWTAAGFAFSNKPRMAPGGSVAVTRFKQGANYTFACFGESRHDACAAMVDNFYASYMAPDVKPEEKPLIRDQLLNAVAVYGDNLRTGGNEGKEKKDIVKSISVLEAGMKVMRQAYANGAHPEVATGNLKLQQNMALAYFAAGRPAEAQTSLGAARAAADAAFSKIEAVRRTPAKLKETQGIMISAETLEREVADYASDRAKELYKEGKRAEAARFTAVAQPAYARGAQWIARVDKEGVVGFAQQGGAVRLGTLKLGQGDLLLAAGDKPGATTAYRDARSVTCGRVSNATRELIAARKPIDDIDQYVTAQSCRRAELGEMKATGELDRRAGEMADDMMRREYQKLGLDYDKLKKK